MATGTHHVGKAIGVATLIVGVLDLAYAMAVYAPHRPWRIPQHIASGLIGAKAFEMGAASVVLGTVLHFVIALGAAVVYYVASRKIRFLVQHPVIAGMIYGACVYGFMHLVVIPLSAVRPGHPRLVYQVAEFVEHWFVVGLPIALCVRRWAGDQE